MIGLGVDIIQISEFEQQINDVASFFVRSSFTAKEIRYAQTNVSRNPAQHLAVRYAAKEAFLKAWSSLYRGRPNILTQPKFTEIEVCNDAFGRPFITTHGTIHQYVATYQIQLSLSHDGDYAIASIIIEQP